MSRRTPASWSTSSTSSSRSCSIPIAAREEGAPLVHEALGTNLAYERTFTFGEVDRAFEEADRSVHRRALLAALDGDADGHERRDRRLRPRHRRRHDLCQLDELHVLPLAHRGLAQGPGQQAAAGPGRRPAEASARSSSCTRFRPSRGSCRCSWASRSSTSRTGRRISANDHCGSDRRYEASLAFDDDGEMKALRISCVDDYGAYLQFGTGTHGNALSQIVGPYRIQHVEYSLAAVLTNKNQQGAYRGFGAEVSNWVLERLVDLAARDSTSTGSRSGVATSSPPDCSRTGRRPGTSTTAATTRESWRKCWTRSTTTPGSPTASKPAPRAAMSGSASSPRRSGACSVRRRSGSGSTIRSSHRRRARRARASASTRPARSSSRCTRSASGEQSRDGRLAGRRRGVRRRPRVRRDQLRRLAERAPGDGQAVALHGDGLRRRRRRRDGAEGQDPPDRRRQARGGRGRPRVPERRRRRRRRPGPRVEPRRDRVDGVHVPARPTGGHGRAGSRRSRHTVTR